MRLGSDTEVRFLELGTKQFRVQVLSGKAIYSELEGSEADIDIEARSWRFVQCGRDATR